MGLNLCGEGAWNWLSTRLSGATGVTRTQSVLIKGKAKCPKCNNEFDAEIAVEQQVQGGVVNFDVKPTGSGLSSLCAWPK